MLAVEENKAGSARKEVSRARIGVIPPVYRAPSAGANPSVF